MLSNKPTETVQIDEELIVGRLIKILQVRHRHAGNRGMDLDELPQTEVCDSSHGQAPPETRVEADTAKDRRRVKGRANNGKGDLPPEPMKQADLTIGNSGGKTLLGSVPRDILAIPIPIDPIAAKAHLDACFSELARIEQLPMSGSSVSRARRKRVNDELNSVIPKYVRNLYRRWLVLSDLDRSKIRRGVLRGLSGRARDYRRFRKWLGYLVSFGLKKLRNDPLAVEILNEILK